MTSGRRSKQLRREQREAAAAAPQPSPLAPASAHPFGHYVGTHIHWQEHMKASLARMMEEAEHCTGQPDCPNDLHRMGCQAVS